MPTRNELEYFIEPQVRQYCGPIYFTRSLEEADGNVTANGSFGLVDTGSRKLLVTCYHVWEEFQKARQEEPNLLMCLCLDAGPAVVFEPSNAIAEDPILDIVTFDMVPLLAACGARKFFPLKQNPPRKVNKGDVLFFTGFPGNSRRVVSSTLLFGRTPFGVKVLGEDGWRFWFKISTLEMQPDDFGGISGAPCFLLRQGKTLQLVGFATSTLFGNLRFTHASVLNEDGTITEKQLNT